MISYEPWLPGNPIITQTNGIISSGDFLVSTDSGMNIQVATGEAYVRGYVMSDTITPLTVANNNSGAIRYDLVCLHVDFDTNIADVRLKTGVLDPIQNDGVWELPLAGIGVPNNASSIPSENMRDLRLISNDFSLKLLCNLSKGTDTTIPAGMTGTLAWPTATLDYYLFQLFNTYIRPRATAWYNAELDVTWGPASATFLPIVFSVFAVDPVTFKTIEIYSVSSAQTTAGDVNFNVNQNLFLMQGYYIYVTAKNTSNQNITIRASSPPSLKLFIATYPIQQEV